MKRSEILNRSGMPLASPSYGAPPFRIMERAALTVQYESKPAAIRDALPEPLKPDGATVSVSFVDAAESPFGAYRACSISLAARLDRNPVSYCQALFIDQEGPIYASREIWGFPATRGEPELILGENRVAGMLDLGFGGQLRGSIPVADETAPTDTVIEPVRATCKLIPGPDGNPTVAQLVTMQPVDIAIKRYWLGDARLETDSESPLDALPVVKVLSGRYTLSDVTFPSGQVAYDYLSASGKG